MKFCLKYIHIMRENVENQQEYILRVLVLAMPHVITENEI